MRSNMRVLFAVVLFAVIFLILFTSCQQDESLAPSPVIVNGKLNIRLAYPGKASYDSAVIVFKNLTTEIKQTLELNSRLDVATGSLVIPGGEWQASIFYYTSEEHNMSIETTGVVSLQISETASELTSGKSEVYVKDGNTLIKKAFKWKDYYRYRLYLDNVLEASVKLPKDPTDPFIEISTFHSSWRYAYADRLFYNGSNNGSSYFYQGGGAFEVYDSVESIIDTTSFEQAILSVETKTWNYANSIVIIYDDEDHELFLFHVWDFRSAGGRVGSRIPFSKSEIVKRKQFRLKHEGNSPLKIP